MTIDSPKMMSSQRKPLYLLGDSQPLFGHGSNVIPSLQESLKVLERNVTRAAYIGASNGDAPEFFELFVAALDHINLHNARMIRADFSQKDRSFLESADLVLLAGGDVDAGWDIISRTGMDALIMQRYHAGAVVCGVSAGAMQLGMGWFAPDEARFTQGLGLVPYYISAHSEGSEWLKLRTLLEVREELAVGYGIPYGGALIYHADRSLEAVRHPVTEFKRSVTEKGRLTESLLLPVA